MMSLSTRLILSVLIFLTCTGLLGISALTGMRGMRTHFDAAADGYERLRTLYEVGNRATTTRQLLAAETPDMALIEFQLTKAILVIEREGDDPSVLALSGLLREATARLDDDEGLRAVSASANAALDQVTRLVGDAKASIIENRRQASAKLTTTIRMFALIGVATLLAGAVVGVLLYRSIMRPVRAMESATDRLANAEFGAQVRAEGDREIRALIEHFNRMSAELDRLHHTMQQEIERQSRQLIRSEQLASVGTLAAGLAHEINNPLGIIAGYAESTSKKLHAVGDGEVDEDLRRRIGSALGMISEEAFRCSGITNTLLDMARPASGAHESVDLVELVRRGVTLVRGSAIAKGRELRFACGAPGSAVEVLGDQSQLLQVVINLITNALEATPEETGCVAVSVERRSADAVVVVEDNGCGMTAEALERVFDPFYTDKPGRGLRGAGLGLSISHAIVQRHDGRLDAHSEGASRGSTLTLEIPCAVTEAESRPLEVRSALKGGTHAVV